MTTDWNHIAAYRFVGLGDPKPWRARIHDQAADCGLLGTVLLAEEGINLGLAGPAAGIARFAAWLREQAPFAAMELRTTRCDAPPFSRLIVKCKSEIIRMNRPAIRPQSGRAPSVDAPTLARWLQAGHDDAGKPLLLLDTRNAFEVDHGRFRGATDWRLERFSDFPDALAAHRDALAGHAVITYCTGGIRCEKAALLMRQAGIDPVLQLDGGILKYFEATGGAHFDGHCFVFDQRVSLDAALTPIPAGPT